MKRTLYLFIALVLPLLLFGNEQESASALFAKGNSYYAKGQYKQALDAYQQLINDGCQSAAVYFNMGNASFKDGENTLAIFYYEKAHKLSPGDDDINFNIRFANLRTTDKIDEAPEFFLTRWAKAVVLSLPAGTFAVLSVMLVLLASVLFIIYLFSNAVGTKKASFYGAVTLLFFGLLATFIASRQVSYFKGHRQAIVFSSTVDVKSGPGGQLNTLFVIHDGAKVNVLESSNGWLKIRLVNDTVGWIKQGAVREI